MGVSSCLLPGAQASPPTRLMVGVRLRGEDTVPAPPGGAQEEAVTGLPLFFPVLFLQKQLEADPVNA